MARAGKVFGLSAAYDLLPVNIIMPQDTEQMALTVNGKKRNIRKLQNARAYITPCNVTYAPVLWYP